MLIVNERSKYIKINVCISTVTIFKADDIYAKICISYANSSITIEKNNIFLNESSSIRFNCIKRITFKNNN